MPLFLGAVLFVHEERPAVPAPALTIEHPPGSRRAAQITVEFEIRMAFIAGNSQLSDERQLMPIQYIMYFARLVATDSHLHSGPHDITVWRAKLDSLCGVKICKEWNLFSTVSFLSGDSAPTKGTRIRSYNC